MIKKFFFRIFFLAVVTATLGCGVKNDPRAVADQFCYHYLIELNQDEALSLASGLAQQKLKKEIELLKGARLGADELQWAKPFIDYEMRRRDDRTDSQVMFYYKIAIEPKGGGKIEEEVIISTVLENGRWTVNNYEHYRPDPL